MGPKQCEYFSTATGERIVDMIDREIFELPRLTAFRDRNVIEPIPFQIKFVWKFRFVFAGLLLHIRFEGRNDFFGSRTVTGKSIDQILDAGFGRRANNDVGLSNEDSNAAQQQQSIGRATLLRQTIRGLSPLIALRGTTSGFERRIGLPARKAVTVSTKPL